ncbi:hypothetical protein HPB51_023988 [Rhipicephalus microplus]|uniref:THAP-type domain-containing protein n=1 Tax=Rhipicephalus microplus TaxID=6941 RepID=A0A9J6ECI7_RHIMP|nr:hypothetical protein HPB51_023988 [Rhipicephalus microplus]
MACCKTGTVRHFFRPPRDAERLALWQRAVPRQDKKLSSTCSVCDLHFSDEDISKVFEHNICGELVTMRQMGTEKRRRASAVSELPELPFETDTETQGSCSQTLPGKKQASKRTR